MLLADARGQDETKSVSRFTRGQKKTIPEYQKFSLPETTLDTVKRSKSETKQLQIAILLRSH